MLLLDVLIICCLLAPISVMSEKLGWELVWQDEFDKEYLDKWQHQVGRGEGYGLPAGWGNDELQCYTARPENSYVTEGKLIIQAQKEDYNGANYTSARLRTINKGDWLYGRFEIRAKSQKDKASDLPFGCCQQKGERRYLEKDTMELRLRAEKLILLN